MIIIISCSFAWINVSSLSEDEHHASRQNDRQEQDDVAIQPAMVLNNTFIHLIFYNEMSFNTISSPLMKLSRSLHEFVEEVERSYTSVIRHADRYIFAFDHSL